MEKENIINIEKKTVEIKKGLKLIGLGGSLDCFYIDKDGNNKL